MKRILYILLFISFLTLVSCEKYDIEAQFTITNFGKITNSVTGQPIQGVVVSDGYSSGITDVGGTYSFIGSTNARFVFYSVPEMYEVPLKSGAPSFYKRIDHSSDSIKINFELTPLKNGIENKFTLISVADPQIKYKRDLNRLNTETIVDLKKEKLAHDIVYGVTLGDLVFDTPELMGDLKQSFISTEIPFFHTIGNHDDFDTYEDTFGPVDYSFNRGKVHVVVMKNVLFKGNSYSAGFTREQINWLKSDLMHVPKNKMVVVSLHIPVIDNSGVEHREEFLDAIKSFKEVHIMSGHYHAHRNYWHADYNIHEHITGAACGIWWAGTINKCGTPNGYGVYEIDGNTMRNTYYKSVNFPRSYQSRMYAPYNFGDTEGYAVANVWNADKDWTIELLENGISSGKMEKYYDYDPGAYSYLKDAQQYEAANVNWAARYGKTDHLFRLKPSDTNAELSVKATDGFGNEYIQTKITGNIQEFKVYK